MDGGPGWEEQTVAETAPKPPPTPPAPPLGRKRRPASDDQVTVDTGGTDDDESTIRANTSDLARLADGTGESMVEEGTIDEPTVEDQARPLPPLSLVRSSNSSAQERGDPLACRFIIEAGNDAGRTFLLTGDKMSIGRGVDNDLVLTDISVSRRHFEISFDGSRYTLHDLGSGNGTLINDRIEDGACQLRHGDQVEIGNTTIRVDHPATRDIDGKIGWGGQANLEMDDEPSTIAAQPRAKSAKGKVALASIAPAKSAAASASLPPPSRLVLPANPQGGGAIPNVVTHPNGVSAPVVLGDGFPQAANLVAMPQNMYSGPQRMPTQIQPVDRRMLVGIISGSIALVVLAVVVAVVRGGDDGKTATGESAGNAPSTAASTTKVATPDEAASKRALMPGVKPESTANNPRVAMVAAPSSVASDLPLATWGNSEPELATKFAKLPKRPAEFALEARDDRFS